MSAFLARETLYNTYRDGTPWWTKNADKETRKHALVYVESALRDNITVLLNRGQETNQLEFFNQAVLQSRRYLATFPADSSAALIHWNMALTLDTKLKQTASAFDEYISISNLYWDSRYQRYAAANAVAMARDAAVSAITAAEQAAQRSVSLADLQKETKNPQGVKFREKMKLEPSELTLEESRLAQAYDNYIKLFPHDKETPLFLANAGALYYRRYQFKEALRYFNTLLRHFPTSEEFAQARYAIMESYFGKADFHSSEIIARRILISDAPEDIKSRAQRRLAESIYLSAEMLAEENKHLDAGNEYRRVVRETPNSSFADLALFNAALEYDKAGEFNRAIETYTSLLTTQKQSNYVLDAQNNLAFDYAELHDYRNAALTYERLAAIQTDSLKARDALFNASLYFDRAEDWESAIKVNRTFLQRYPRDESADEAAFDIALFYRRLNKFDKSEEAFLDFIKSYPASPRIVEAYYLRGRRLYENGESRPAQLEFQNAIAASQELEKNKLDRNDFFAAEAEFSMATILFDESDKLLFKMPLADLNRNKQRKKDLLLEIVRHLSACAAFGTPRVYEATYQVGLAYQKFAETWAGQELPEMEANRKIVAQKEINDAAVVLSERAAGVYGNAIKGLRRLRDSYYQNLSKSITDSLQLRGVVQQDTLLRIADKWVERSKERLTEVLYSMGDLRFESARMVQEAPVPKGLNDLQQLVYRKQLLQIGTVPLLKQAFEEYSRNVMVADTLGFTSTWVELSRQKLVAIQTAVPANYTRLALDGLTTMSGKFAAYSNLIYSGRSLDDMLDDLASQGRDLANMVDFCHALMDSAIVGYKQTLTSAAQWQASSAAVLAVQDSMMGRINDYSSLSDSLAANAKQRAIMARDRFVATQDPVLEEGLFTFESNYFSLRNANKEVLERGYRTSQELNISGPLAQMALLRLVALDPDVYAGQAGLQVAEKVVEVDTTWRAASTYYEGWTRIGFDAANWGFAQKADSAAAGSVWYYEPSPDTTIVAPIPVARMYIRTVFSVPGLPVSCMVSYQAVHHVSFYLNGDSMKRVKAGDKQEPIDMTDAVSSGSNVWAMEAVRAAEAAPGIAARAVVRYLPGWEEKVKSLNLQAASGKNP
jgi:TolA-binding protein